MSDERGRIDRAFGLLAAAEAAVFLAIGSYAIGRHDLWLDESVSARLARDGPRAVLRNFRDRDATMVLYNATLAAWRRLGSGEGWLRSLSLFACVGAVVLVAVIGRRLFDATTGLVAGGILALSPFVLRYAQEARSYGMTMFLVVLTTYFLLRALDDPLGWWWLPCAVAAALACYSHSLSVWVLVAQGLVACVRMPPPAARIRVLVAGGVFAVLVTPLAFATILHGSGQIAWIDRPTIDSVASVVARAAGSPTLAVVVGALCLGTIVVAGRAWRTSGRAAAWPYAFVSAWWAIPFVGMLLFSILVTPTFIPRYLIAAMPGVALAAAACARRLPRPLAVLALAGIAVASVAVITDYYAKPRGPQWSEVAAYLAARADGRDGITYCPRHLGGPLGYYLTELGVADRPMSLLRSPTSRAAFASDPTEVWLLITRDADVRAGRPECDVDGLGEGRELRSVTSFGPIDVKRWGPTIGSG